MGHRPLANSCLTARLASIFNGFTLARAASIGRITYMRFGHGYGMSGVTPSKTTSPPRGPPENAVERSRGPLGRHTEDALHPMLGMAGNVASEGHVRVLTKSPDELLRFAGIDRDDVRIVMRHARHLLHHGTVLLLLLRAGDGELVRLIALVGDDETHRLAGADADLVHAESVVESFHAHRALRICGFPGFAIRPGAAMPGACMLVMGKRGRHEKQENG